eukprot:6868018-Prymnesium_polylepis.1
MQLTRCARARAAMPFTQREHPRVFCQCQREHPSVFCNRVCELLLVCCVPHACAQDCNVSPARSGLWSGVVKLSRGAGRQGLCACLRPGWRSMRGREASGALGGTSARCGPDAMAGED